MSEHSQRRMASSSHPLIEARVSKYYSERLQDHGATPKGVDWKDEISQTIRFEQLARILSGDMAASVIDWGCGYGALLTFLRERGFTGAYVGLDITAQMITAARELHRSVPGARFLVGSQPDEPADYVLSSGVFNVRLGFTEGEWHQYILANLDRMHRSAIRGLAFNCLTNSADEDKKRPDLYYADPCDLFDLCRRCYSRHIVLLHDYDLYEFTLLVRLYRPGTGTSR